MQAKVGIEMHILGAEGAALTTEISIDFDGDGTWDYEELFPEFRPAAGSLGHLSTNPNWVPCILLLFQ